MRGDCECLVEHPSWVTFADRLRSISIKPLVQSPQGEDCDASHTDLPCSSRVASKNSWCGSLPLVLVVYRLLWVSPHVEKSCGAKFHLHELRVRAVELLDEHQRRYTTSTRWQRYSLSEPLQKYRKRRLSSKAVIAYWGIALSLVGSYSWAQARAL